MTDTVVDHRAEAAGAYRASVTAGKPLTQAQLGERFGMSRSWARDIVREVNQTATDGSHTPAAAPPPAATAPTVAAAVVEWQPPPADTARPAATVADTPRRRLTANGLTVALVAVVAAAASYGHMLHVAELAGEPLWIARMWPISVDGLAYAALRRGDAGRRWLTLSLIVSVAANVVAQYPELAADAGPFVSAWPPVALYGCHRLTHGSRST